MSRRQIIDYIKTWTKLNSVLQKKSNSLYSIWDGLFWMGLFLVPSIFERYILRKEIKHLCKQNPNYKYIYYFSVAVGIWGIIDIIRAVINYFWFNSLAKELEIEAAELEKSIVSKD